MRSFSAPNALLITVATWAKTRQQVRLLRCLLRLERSRVGNGDGARLLFVPQRLTNPSFRRAGGKKRAVRKIHQRAMLAEAPAGLGPTEKPAQAKRDQWTWNTAE